MGVYIKNMTKQQALLWLHYQMPFCFDIDDDSIIEMEEPHGRLIDADKLMDDIKRNSASYFADDFAREWVDVQPTVIEAED